MKSLYLLLLLFIASNINAQRVSDDVIIWKGDTLSLFSNPLEFRSDWKEISKIIDIELEKEKTLLYPNKEVLENVEEDNLRQNYICEWKLFENKIYLSNIYESYNHKIKLDLKLIFGNKLIDNLLFASWIYESIIIPKGKCIVNLSDLRNNSIFETEIVLKFKKGLLINTKKFHNFIAKKSKFSSDSNPNNIMEFKYSKINWDILPDLKNRNIQVFVSIQPNKNGTIESVISKNTYMLEGNNIVQNQNNIFIMEAIRVAKLIPDWTVIYQRGKINSTGFILDFNENMKNKHSH